MPGYQRLFYSCWIPLLSVSLLQGLSVPRVPVWLWVQMHACGHQNASNHPKSGGDRCPGDSRACIQGRWGYRVSIWSLININLDYPTSKINGLEMSNLDGHSLGLEMCVISEWDRWRTCLLEEPACPDQLLEGL